MASQEEFEKMSDSEKKKEDWMNSKWRPMMGWMYMLTCITDFIVFPILWSLLQAVMKTGAITQWQPLTLQGAGLFHIAMGAVLGLAAYGRTQEKIAGANNGGAPTPAPSFTPAPAAPVAVAPVMAPVVKPVTPIVTTSSTGKAMPAPQVDEPL
jgi:hypothetical protein